LTANDTANVKVRKAERHTSALVEMGIIGGEVELLQDHDGVRVYRVKADGNRYVMKYFDNPAHRREIGNYHLLSAVGVPTLPLLAQTPTALLLPDVTAGTAYRLGNKSDFDNARVASAIGHWYKTLHTAGREADLAGLYDENKVITLDNCELIAVRTETIDNPVWSLIRDSLPEISNRLARLPRTLTYNDFFWTNLIVSHDNTSAMMLDYNLLGKGYAYSDIRNVTTWLSKDATNAFLDEYGRENINTAEVTADKALAPLVSLYYAFIAYGFDLSNYPDWVEPSLSELKTGKLLENLRTWLDSADE